MHRSLLGIGYSLMVTSGETLAVAHASTATLLRAQRPSTSGRLSFPPGFEARYASGVSNVAFDVPEETLVALKLDQQSASAELRLVAAVKLFELGRLSSGAAAKLAGVPRVVFLAKLGELGAAALRQTEAELAEDLAHA